MSVKRRVCKQDKLDVFEKIENFVEVGDYTSVSPECLAKFFSDLKKEQVKRICDFLTDKGATVKKKVGGRVSYLPNPDY